MMKAGTKNRVMAVRAQRENAVQSQGELRRGLSSCGGEGKDKDTLIDCQRLMCDSNLTAIESDCQVESDRKDGIKN